MRKNYITIEFKIEEQALKVEYRHRVMEDGTHLPSIDNIGGDFEALSEFYKLAKDEARALVAKLQSAIESVSSNVGDVQIFIQGR